ncbi:predicted DNA alkylation repair enzyme [Longilinea arvoryzae]|uniref:Predicted DNA alkylation repair enzyme n=1 Tax=Longilinea arvoryzae TaxID=360412 RepID=A0A0S7BNI2_9CHLR|nr:DNA alkylation repair protein [Longilinea arvoryzae]GAP15537.1 predicted DNA alkylation repair enzyme [Longilinea arvoryzae]
MTPPKQPPLTLDEILARLNALADPRNVEGQRRFGIRPAHQLGISMPALRGLAKGRQRSHDLALQLWATRIHEARILASLVDDPQSITREQMEAWVQDFDSWDVCDQVCMNLFGEHPLGLEMARTWPHRPEEFVRRAGFVLMAVQAVHRRDLPDQSFQNYFPLMLEYANDERNFVRKAINWALRQIGKRNAALCQGAIQTAQQMLAIESPSARWIARDALRELEKPERIR